MNKSKKLLKIGALAVVVLAAVFLASNYLNFSGQALSNLEIVQIIKPATVFIETDYGVGSGMIFDKDGYILTNAHVVEGVSTAKVKLSNGTLHSASVIGRDELIDV